MMRSWVCILVTVWSVGAAAPTTRPVAAPTTRSAKPQADLGALHVQAYELLVQGNFQKAKVPLEKVYAATPAAGRERALVLNHAIVDATQKTLVMRAIKDLTEYLKKHRDPDEQATNLLGGALNIAAGDARLKQGELWQNAYREWERRNYVLDHSRKGWRRWGTRWMSDAEYDQIQAEIKSLKQAVIDQQAVTDRAYDHAWSVSQQLTNALNAKENARYIIQYLQWNNGSYNLPNRLNMNPNDPNYMQFQQPAVVADYTNAYMEAQRLGPEMEVALKDYQREMGKLQELQNKVIRPQWPTKFEPVDPDGPEREKPMATTLPVASTAPAENKKELGGVFKPPPAPPAQPAPPAANPAQPASRPNLYK